MATRIRIQCVTTNSSGTITHIGGKSTNNGNWQLTVSEAVSRIELGYEEYYILRNGNETDVEVVNGSPKYLRTKPDATTRNNLSDLPDCPV